MTHIPTDDNLEVKRDGHREEVDGVTAGSIRRMFREVWRAVGDFSFLSALKIRKELEAALDEVRYGSGQGNGRSGEDRRRKRKLSRLCVFLKKCTRLTVEGALRKPTRPSSRLPQILNYKTVQGTA